MTTFMEGSNVSTKSVTALVNMLRHCRPDQSDREAACVVDWLVPLGLKWDKFGNGYKRIGKDPIIAWSCHTDTVHSWGGTQLIEYNPDTGNVKLDKKSKSNCLGADDTAGMWIMMEMLKAKVPGLYLFHRAEEVGTKGSKWIAEKTPQMFEGVQACIAFDRRGKDSVITHQRGMRCCSDEFALSLGGKLGEDFKKDPTGLYTDSASYVDLVAECTNVSVGYTGEHTSSETLHVPTAVKLLDHMLQFDAAGLVVKRKAGDKESRWPATTYYGRGANFRSYGHWEGGKWVRNTNDDLDDTVDRFSLHGKDYCPPEFTGFYYSDGKLINCTHTRWIERGEEVKKLKDAEKPSVIHKLGPPSMVNLIKMYPDEIATMMHDFGFDPKGLQEEIASMKKVEASKSLN